MDHSLNGVVDNLDIYGLPTGSSQGSQHCAGHKSRIADWINHAGCGFHPMLSDDKTDTLDLQLEPRVLGGGA